MNNSSERTINHQRRVEKGDIITHDDDGFFSDVPLSGSLSRSMLALNKYVKTNLLFDDSEDVEDYKEHEDSAYFSKESSPNDSVVRYDTDSLKSDDSTESKVSQFVQTAATAELKIVTTPIDEFSQTDDYKSLQLQDSSRYENIDPLTIVKYNTNIHELQSETVPEETNYEFESNSIHSRVIKNSVVLIEYSNIRNHTNEETETETETDVNLYQNILGRQISSKDYENSQIIKNINLNGHETSYLPVRCTSLDDENSTSISLREHIIAENVKRRRPLSDYQVIQKQIDDTFTSIDNAEPENTIDQGNNDSNGVLFREKGCKLKKQDYRHTLQDFSKWGNRTDIYPDVYAPLPYKSPRRYVESDVNIHYRCPVRHDPLPLVPERELARQQAEHMKRLYREQKRNKYLQELQDMQNRRHQDNFTPSQKTVVPLNRYDETDKVIAKALYTFNGQTARELSFRKGDIIHVRRQIDSNWYEGEVHGKVGLFPYNYVEIQKGDTVQTVKKPAVVEGRARAKFDFTAQTNLELPLKKGEVVVLTRRIDQNWWEGRNGVKTGIFPDSYVTVLQEPSPSKPESKPAASPAAHGLLNGSDKRSMGAHSYTPQQNSAALANAPPATAPLPGYPVKSPHTASGGATERGQHLNNSEPLYVDTNAEAVPYRAMYKYRPQNPDELELSEGDTVFVLEKCDDGWYVGSSQRTGRFGTFPGNYVERI